MTLGSLVVRYAAFAVVATIANLAAQRLVLAVDSSVLGFAAAVVVGTGVGLIVKYVLDKRWIFYDASTGVQAHSRKFALYTAMGLITTAIFWGSETAFCWVWRTDLMRELGACLGLAVGYVVKYQLDRRFVFSPAASATSATKGGA